MARTADNGRFLGDFATSAALTTAYPTANVGNWAYVVATGTVWVWSTSWGDTGGVGAPAGADTQVQFNDGGAFGASSDFTFTKGTKALTLGGKVSKYNNIATVSGGIPSELATVDLTGQTAAKSATTIYTPTASGLFRISIALQVTTPATTGAGTSILGGTTGVTITYTEPDGSVAQSIKPLLTSQAGAVVVPASGNTGNATTTQSQGSCVINAKTGVAIQYAIGYTSDTAAEMVYAAHLKLESL